MLNLPDKENFRQCVFKNGVSVGGTFAYGYFTFLRFHPQVPVGCARQFLGARNVLPAYGAARRA